MKLVIIMAGHEGVGKRSLAETLYREHFVRHIHNTRPLHELLDQYEAFMRENIELMVVTINDPNEVKTFISVLTVPYFIIQIKRKGVMTDVRHPIEDLGIIPVYHNDYDLKTSKDGFLALINGVCKAVKAREYEHDRMMRAIDKVLERS